MRADTPLSCQEYIRLRTIQLRPQEGGPWVARLFFLFQGRQLRNHMGDEEVRRGGSIGNRPPIKKPSRLEEAARGENRWRKPDASRRRDGCHRTRSGQGRSGRRRQRRGDRRGRESGGHGNRRRSAERGAGSRLVDRAGRLLRGRSDLLARNHGAGNTRGRAMRHTYRSARLLDHFTLERRLIARLYPLEQHALGSHFAATGAVRAWASAWRTGEVPTAVVATMATAARTVATVAKQVQRKMRTFWQTVIDALDAIHSVRHLLHVRHRDARLARAGAAIAMAARALEQAGHWPYPFRAGGNDHFLSRAAGGNRQCQAAQAVYKEPSHLISFVDEFD